MGLLSSIMETTSFTSPYIASIVCGHRSLVSDIDWTRAVAHAIANKMVSYNVIDSINGDTGSYTIANKFLNMTHLSSSDIVIEIQKLKHVIGIISIEY